MSISLKTTNANEILESMAETLNDSNFIGLYKKAGEVDGFRERTPQSPKLRPSIQQLYQFAVTDRVPKYIGSNTAFEKDKDEIEFTRKEYDKAHPQKAEDSQFVIDEGISTVDIKPPQSGLGNMKYSPENVEAIKEKLRLAKEEQEKKILEKGKEIAQNIPVAQNQLNKADDVALAYTIKNLTKLANALDVNGYAGIANIVDKTISKVSSILNKKAMETGYESFDEEKKEELDKVKELLDMGDYSGAMMLIGKLGGVVEDVGDLGSSIEPKTTSDLDFS